MQLRDSSSGGVFDGVAHGDDPCELVINVHHNRGATVCFGGGKGVGESTEVLVAGATNADAVAFDGTAYTHASFGLEIVGGRMIRGVCDDRFGDGVLGARLNGGRVVEQLMFIGAFGGGDVGNAHNARGHRAGLI